MPIYEYQCESCSHRFERFQSASSKSEGLICPDCGAEQGRRLLSAIASPSKFESAGNCSKAGCNPPPGLT